VAIKLDRQSHPVHLSNAVSAQADLFVQQGSGGRAAAGTHPFRRKIDFWVMSISYAVFLDLDPAADPPTDKFVSISTNPKEGPSLPDEVQTALIALHVAEHQDVPVDDIDLTPTAILRTADRYAEVGAGALIERLRAALSEMDVQPYQGMAEMLFEDLESVEGQLLAIPT
jgi:hypothetical protein